MKLAVLGDLHYSDMHGESESVLQARNIFFQEVLGQFFAEKADYYVSLGDLTHSGTAREFEFLMNTVRERKLENKFIHILGNHELKHLRKADVLSITKQPRYRYIDAAEARLVFLDTSVEHASHGNMDNEQLRWFRSTVEGAGARHLLVFAHHPVYGTTPRSAEGGGRTAVCPDIDMRGILYSHRHLGLYVNGHVHMNAIVRENRWHYIQTTSMLDYPGFRIMEITNAHVKVDFVRIGNESLDELRLRIARRMDHFKFSEHALGAETDRAAMIS